MPQSVLGQMRRPKEEQCKILAGLLILRIAFRVLSGMKKIRRILHNPESLKNDCFSSGGIYLFMSRPVFLEDRGRTRAARGRWLRLKNGRSEICPTSARLVRSRIRQPKGTCGIARRVAGTFVSAEDCAEERISSALKCGTGLTVLTAAYSQPSRDSSRPLRMVVNSGCATWLRWPWSEAVVRSLTNSWRWRPKKAVDDLMVA